MIPSGGLDVLRDILAGLGGLALPGGFLFWWRDRRKAKAASIVAERTVDADVVVKDAGGWQARLAYASAAFDQERDSFTTMIEYRDREIALRDRIIAQLRADVQHKDDVIEQLRRQIDDLEQQLFTASRQLSAVRDQLEELANPRPDDLKESP